AGAVAVGDTHHRRSRQRSKVESRRQEVERLDSGGDVLDAVGREEVHRVEFGPVVAGCEIDVRQVEGDAGPVVVGTVVTEHAAAVDLTRGAVAVGTADVDLVAALDQLLAGLGGELVGVDERVGEVRYRAQAEVVGHGGLGLQGGVGDDDGG